MLFIIIPLLIYLLPLFVTLRHFRWGTQHGTFGSSLKIVPLLLVGVDEDCHHGHSDDDDYSHDDDEDVVEQRHSFSWWRVCNEKFLDCLLNPFKVWICPHVGGWLLRETNLQLEGFIISILLHRIMMEHKLNLSLLVINFYETGLTRLRQFQACEVAANGEWESHCEIIIPWLS